MSKPAYEKNRYLRLDGSPVEQGAIRRTLAPRGIALSFLVAVGTTADINKIIDDPFEYTGPVVLVGLGLIQRRFLNITGNAMWLMDFHRYAIDTKPSSRTQNNPPDNYHLISTFSTAVYSLLGLKGIVNVGTEYANIPYSEAISETLLPEIAMQFPTFQLAFQQGYAHYKVRKGEWKVIKRVDMEPEPEAKTSRAECLPSPSIVAT